MTLKKSLLIGSMLVLFGAIALLATCGGEPVATWKARLSLTFDQSIRRLSCAFNSGYAPNPAAIAAINMQDASGLLGPTIVTKTFSLAISDLNNDSRDDILISGHELNPYLLINENGAFHDASGTLVADRGRPDRHGYTLADLDNDGDLDIAIAGGGADGIGKGTPNMILRNDSRTGEPHFTRLDLPDAIGMRKARSRALIPVASADGRAVDLYHATLTREGFPNILLENHIDEGVFRLTPVEEGFLTFEALDHGRGTMADFDGDGRDDYLYIEGASLKLHWHPASGRTTDILASRVFSIAAGDFNNDGALDVFVGRYSPPTSSDNVSHDTGELIYRVHRNGDRDWNAISFQSRSPSLRFNLKQHVPLFKTGQLRDAADIYLGREGHHPSARQFDLDTRSAAGEPDDFSRPGTYIWYSVAAERWHMRWEFHADLDHFKGSLEAEGLSGVLRENFQSFAPKVVRDSVLFNDGKGRFDPSCEQLPPHTAITAGVTAADFNNDGWLDVMGVRHDDEGLPNGDTFILANNAGRSFSESVIRPRPEDELHRADLIAHGFIDADRRPDVVLTNGFGQHPGTNGSPRLFLNRTTTPDDAILVSLQGTNANRSAVGAKALLRDSHGDIVGFRVQGLNTNISQDTHWLHFGLGQAVAPYTLEVDWPDESRSEHTLAAPGSYPVVQP
tara:strand:+ start:4039 stop:6069 length:2031 start_codon:yes stop_codon:yes gene_type:complete